MTEAASRPDPLDKSSDTNALPKSGTRAASAHSVDSRPNSRWAAVWSAAQLFVALALTIAMLVYLVVTPATSSPPESSARAAPPQAVEQIGPGLIRIQPGSSLETKLQTLTLETSVINTPLLTVTGTVSASLRPGR